MSNTSNRWKSQGGINRRPMNNILSNHKQATNTLTIPQQLGISNTTLEQYGDKRDMDNSALYKMTEGEQSYDTIIAYYPFNNLGESGTQTSSGDMIYNETLNKNITSVSKEGNFNLLIKNQAYNYSIQVNFVYPYVVEIPAYSQNAIQFRIPKNSQDIQQNPTCLISKESLNTLNTFSQTKNTESISSILTFETFLFIPTGTENFCIFALDDLVQSGLYQNSSSDDSSPDCFYLWYKGGETYGNTLQTYYSYDNSGNVTEINEKNCGEIVPDTWHKITVVFGGSYIALYIDGKQTFQQVISNGSYSYIPDKPIAFNLGPLTEPFSNGTGSSSDGTGFGSSFNFTPDMTPNYNYLVTPDGTGPMLLDAKVSLKANTKEFIEYLANPGNKHQYASSRIPNSDEKRLLYLLSDEMVGFNAPVTCENDVAIAGKLTSFGETNIYAQSNFHDITRFYGDVIFESETKIVYGSTAIGYLDILSAQDSSNTSILVQNDFKNNHMPSMLVYNTENSINKDGIKNTENLIFSISGENVSIGEIYGQNTFDVKGDSSFLGKVGIGTDSPTTTLDVQGQITSSGKISGNGGIHSGSAKASGFFVNSNDTNQLPYNDIKDARGYIGTNYSNTQNELDFHSINTNNNMDQPGGFRFYGHKHNSTGGDLYCNINSTGMHLNGKFTVTKEMEISDNVRLNKSLDVHGVTTFQAITYGITPQDDASGQEFPTCQWINDNYSAAGGWKKEEINNGIYNSNIEKLNGYVGIGTKTPEYMLDVSGDIHMIKGNLMLDNGDISMNGSITADGSITTRSDITVDGSANIGFDMTIGGKVGIGLGTETIDPSFVLDISGDMYSNGNILTRGKVGIGARGTPIDGIQTGTNEPQADLDVGGSMRVSGQVDFVNGPVFGPAPNDSSGGLQLVTMDWVLGNVGNNGGWITSGSSIYNGNIDDDKTNAFVGIGTMTPESTLDVSGNTNLNGKITFSNNISIQSAIITDPPVVSIAIGSGAGAQNQGKSSIAMGSGAGGQNQGESSIAIGYGAGGQNQGYHSIAIGYYAGYGGTDDSNYSQPNYSIAIGDGVKPTEEYEIRFGDTSNNVVIPGTLHVAGNSIYSKKISGNGGIHSGSAKASGFFVNSNDTNLPYSDIEDARGYIGTNYSDDSQNELDFHSINTNNNTDQPGGFRFYGHKHNSTGGDLYCNINSTGMHLNGKFTVTKEIEISNNVNSDKVTISNNSITVETINSANISNSGTLSVNGLDVTGESIFHSDMDISQNKITVGTINSVDISNNGTLSVAKNTTLKGALMVGDSTDTDTSRYASLLHAGQTANDWNWLTFGKINSSGNQAELGFQWIEDNSPNNKLSLGFYGYQVMYILNSGNVGIGTNDPSQKLTVNGNIKCSSQIESGTFNAVSDLRLKENIHDLSNSLEKICAIRGVEYNWKADEEKKLHSGVIAQEVKESIPEAVNTDNEEQYSVNYNAIIGHLIEAVKTLKQEVDDLKGQLNK